jgi:hypothetical protein
MTALIRLLSMCWLVAAIAAAPVALAQDEGQSDEAEQSSQSEPPALSQAELEQLVAPIALYPDSLLSQIFMASAYPFEVVEAARWSRDNPGLKGDAAVSAVADEDWDASVKALVAFPDVLARMDQDLRWLQRLGNAVAAQQADVMAAVQSLRQKASTAGKLESSSQARVTEEQNDIVVEPPNPDVVYVPYYDPTVVYGPWPWPDYPPYYWPPPPGIALGVGIVWIGGIHVFPNFFYSSLYWPRRVLILVDHKPPPRADFILRHRNRTDYARIWHFDPTRRYGFIYRGRPFEGRPTFNRTPGMVRPGIARPGGPFPGRAVQPSQAPPGGAAQPGGGMQPQKRGFILRGGQD